MKQLTALDNMFLALEQGNQYMHVASLGIYDPSSAPGGKVRFKQILAHYASRLEQSKIYQRRLATVPLGLDLPFWVDEGDIDLEYHVRHMALPHPGDWRQLMIQVARLHSRPLDHNRPLWETYVIEGLDNIEGLPKGCFAIYAKIHHALVDGETGAELIRIQHDLMPVGRPVESLRTHIADAEPSTLELVTRGISNRAARLIQTGRVLLNVGATGLRLSGKLVTQAAADPSTVSRVARNLLETGNPGTRFSAAVSPHRIVDGISLPLAEFQHIRSRLPGISHNDIFLAVAAGAIRKYLGDKNELPGGTLHAAVPVSIRGEKKTTDAGNMVSGTFTALHTNIADPVERLQAIHASMEKSKRVLDVIGQDLLTQLSQLIPQAPVHWVQKYLVAPRASVTVSNVRGPNVPLYFAGARLVRFMPISIATDGVGLNLTGFSYDNQFWGCVVSCRKMMPDPSEFATCLQESFRDLLTAVSAPAIEDATRAPAKARRRKKLAA